MADGREVFTILENNSTAAGVKLPARSEGDAVGGNHVPVALAKDGSGNYQLLPIRAEGAAVAGNEVPVLAAKTASGNWAHVPLDVNNRVPTADYLGSLATLKAHDVVEAVLSTPVDTAVITLTNDVAYRVPDFISAASALTTWELIWLNDVTETTLASWLTGAGALSFAKRMEDIAFTAGSSGTQELKLVGTQNIGAATDLHGTLSVLVVG